MAQKFQFISYGDSYRHFLILDEALLRFDQVNAEIIKMRFWTEGK